MCKVILQNSQNIDFIIYNLLFTENNRCFTTDNLLDEIQSYDAQITKHALQIKIDALISEGLVREKIGSYCTTI